jgi:hypothetical protein
VNLTAHVKNDYLYEDKVVACINILKPACNRV